MSLYHEAAEVLDIASRNGGSVKSIVFGRKDWKSDRKSLFVLSIEAAKWSNVLSDVVEKSGVLKAEKQLTPKLALLLTHDLLLAKKGLALPPKHGLTVAITRHKARLSAELTKVRLGRGFSTLDALRAHVDNGPTNIDVEVQDGQVLNFIHPRWVRINTLRHSLEEQLTSTFAAYERTTRLSDITSNRFKENLYIDEHVSNLIAIRPDVDITSSTAYKDGQLILQDKASCFPAYLLDPNSVDGDIIDACAGPGNKTTHLAALVSSHSGTMKTGGGKRRIIACERDGPRSETLAKMVNLAGAGKVVRIKAKQDFLKLDPHSPEFANVAAVLLDPSCSGSGIVGRDETTVNIRLPSVDQREDVGTNSKKRKRRQDKADLNQAVQTLPVEAEGEEVLERGTSKLKGRLAALSSFQIRLLEHAMALPAARRITYSTCSIHKEENEHVIVKALLSHRAVKRGWRIMRREEQVEGLQKWDRRGNFEAVSEMLQSYVKSEIDLNANVVADACIKCDKTGEDGTMGFFVAGFVRDTNSVVKGATPNSLQSNDVTEDGDSEDEWKGFSDDDRRD